MKRFAGLDFLRALGVFLGLVFTFGQFLPAADVQVVFWYLLLPLFGLVSGGALTVTLLQRTHKHPWQLVYRWTVFHALALVVVGLLGKYLMGWALPASDPVSRRWGLLGAALGFGPFGGTQALVWSDPVTSLGVGILVFALVLRWVFRQDVEEHFASHWTVLLLCALGFSFMQYLGADLKPEGFWTPVIQVVFQGFFPLAGALASLFWGSLLGLLLVTQRKTWEIPGLLGASLAPPSVLLVLQALGVNPVLVGWNAFLPALDLAFLFNLSLIILLAAHPEPGKTRGWFKLVTRPLRPYGRLPLTVFLLTPVLTMGLIRSAEALGLDWMSLPVWGTTLIALGLASLWGIALHLWKRASYRGSPDWLVQYALRFTGKPSGRLMFLQEEE